jgi:ketosteroid isomerase-like protein
MPRGIWLAVMGIAAAQPLPASAQSNTALARLVAKQGPVVEAVRAFITAQHDFDLAKVKALTTDDYVEISPLGEVDPREKMLGFYTPDKKVAAPALQMGDATVTMVGDRAAVVVTSMSYDIAGPGQPARTVSLRAVFVAERTGGVWKFVSAQYTPIRAKT